MFPRFPHFVVTTFPENGEADGMGEVRTPPSHTPSSPTITEADVEVSLELESPSSKFSKSIIRTIFSVPSNWLRIAGISLLCSFFARITGNNAVGRLFDLSA